MRTALVNLERIDTDRVIFDGRNATIDLCDGRVKSVIAARIMAIVPVASRPI